MMKKRDQDKTLVDEVTREVLLAERSVNTILTKSATQQGKPSLKYQIEKEAVIDLLNNTDDFDVA